MKTEKMICVGILWVIVISYLSWSFFAPLYFLCFIPFFWLIENKTLSVKKRVIGYFAMLLGWNFSVTYWLCAVNFWYGVGAIIANSLLMFLALLFLTLFSERFINPKLKMLFCLVGWLLFEFVHHQWEISWTWLTIGNIFGNITSILSVLVKYTRKESKKHVTVSFVRTQFDAGNAYTDNERINAIVKSDSLQNDSSDILLLPELFLSDGIWDFPDERQYVKKQFQPLFEKFKTRTIITGAVLKRENSKNGIHKLTGSYPIKYDLYNAAVLISLVPETGLKLKVKKEYVPFEEYVPLFLKWLPFKTVNFSKINTPDFFTVHQTPFFISLCYESINSFFISNKINNDGAIFILASEAFFNGSKVGMKQYMCISALRSIENRKPIVKSSNCGTSFYYDAMGDLKLLMPEEKNIGKRIVVNYDSGKTIYNFFSPYYGYILLLIFFYTIMRSKKISRIRLINEID